MTSVEQDRMFIASVISRGLLEDAITWIANNMDPDDVFSMDVLAAWADAHDYAKVES
jgi:hypothetical protein